MSKLTIKDLLLIQEKTRNATFAGKGSIRAKIIIHMGTCGIAAGAKEIMTTLMQNMEKKRVADVLVTTSGCAGLCSGEPMATVEIAGEAPVKYNKLTKKKIVTILEKHVLQGELVENCALAVGCEQTHL